MTLISSFTNFGKMVKEYKLNQETKKKTVNIVVRKNVQFQQWD